MKVNNCINEVQNYYLNHSDPKKKGKKVKQASDSFADLVNLAGVWMNGITQEGKDSKGDKQLTEAQRKYLSQKYNVKDMTASQRQSLLGELTNMGALSFEDYRLSHLTTLPIWAARVGETQNSYVTASEEKNPSDDCSCLDAVAYYKNTAQRELEDGDTVFQRTGKRQKSFKEFSASHNRVADLLQKLVRTK